MTKYILHGGFERADNEQNSAFYNELVKDVPDNGTILLSYFAAEERNLAELFEDHKKRIEPHANGRTFNYVMATKKDFLNQITQANAIHFRGGDTNTLIATLRTYPDLKPLFEKKTVSGSSAGAYALSAYGAAHSQTDMRQGLGLVPVRVVCHYESPELAPSPESVTELENTAQDLELVFLRDYEWRVF